MTMKTIIIAILCWCYTGFAYSNSQPVLHLYTEHFPPYSFLKNNLVVGLNTEIVAQTCVLAAIKCDIRLLPWNRAMAMTNKNKHSGIYSMSRTHEREKNYNWVGPLVASKNYLFRLKSRTNIDVYDLPSAKKYSIAAPRNDIYEKLLQERGFKSLFQVSSKFEGVKLFLAEKIDLLIASPLTLPYQLIEHGANIAMLEQLITFPVPELKGNYLALHPDIAPEQVKKLQQALDLLYSSGKVEQLIQRYKKDSFHN